MERNKELRKAVKKVYAYHGKADVSVQDVNRLLKFEGFDYYEPHTSMCAEKNSLLNILARKYLLKKP